MTASNTRPVWFILPTQSPIKYRGERPNYARHVSGGLTGVHIELLCGIRLWSANPSAMPTCQEDLAGLLATARPMTAGQYEELLAASRIPYPRGLSREAMRAHRQQVRALVRAIGQEAAPQAAPQLTRIEAATQRAERASAYYRTLPRGACTFVAYYSDGTVAGLYALGRFDRASWRYAFTNAQHTAGEGGRVEWFGPDMNRVPADAFQAAPQPAKRQTAIKLRGFTETRPQAAQAVVTVDLTPTWAGVMPGLIAALQNGTGEGPAMAQQELMRLARLVDDMNAKNRP